MPAPKFCYALAAYGTIDANGNNLSVDSYDSLDPLASTNELYLPSKSRDGAEVAAGSGLVNPLSVGTTVIKGSFLTFAGGPADIGPRGSIGSSAWFAAGLTGIQPGHYWDDLVLDLPDSKEPFSGGAFYPIPGIANLAF